MRPFALGLALLISFVGTGRAQEDPEPPGGGAELRKLQGAWRVSRMVFQGKESKGQPKLAMIYTFSGSKLTMSNGRTTTTYTLKLDKRKKPPVFTMTPEKGTVTRKMAFELKKDELFLAMGGLKGSTETPTKFDGSEGPVMIFTREKK